MGLSDTPPQLDADSVSRSSRDPLLGPGLVEGGVAVGDQVQGCGLLGEVERVLVAHV